MPVESVFNVKKVGVSSIEIEEVVAEVVIPATAKTVVYERGFIENQIVSITAQRDAMIAEKAALIAAKEVELAKCEDIIAKMDSLEIKTINATEEEIVKP